MMRVKSLQVLAITWVALSLSVNAAQRNSDSRDKTEKVGNVLAALEAAPGRVIADLVAQELTATGFQVIETRPDFLPFRDPKHKGGFWLIVARKPPLQ